ncbi:MAG: acyl-CoA/acyl-ACP dehydrogenase [Pigmentiphaga sp.]|nr:acyl-CoA/acyl-ACP dehydrogenase [Pigmentiphaga sp.]
MNFALNDDHILLRDTAQAFLRKEVDLQPLLMPGATVREAGYDRLWPKLVELGWPSLVVPEAYGGLGMSMVDLALIVKECGRFLAPSPLFGTLAGSWALMAAGSEAQKQAWLPVIAEGGATFALAAASREGSYDPVGRTVLAVTQADGVRLDGSSGFVVDATVADHFVVAANHEGRERFFLVDRHAAGMTIEPLAWRDPTRHVAHLHFNATPGEPLEIDAADTWPWIRDRLSLMLAAESAGGLQEVLDDTVEYAKERVAFGRPIGAYQAIKHDLADMLAQSECASTAVLYAAWALSDSPDEARVAAAMAQSYASDAYREATHRSIQIFGAIGFTWEMKNHLYYKRARCNAELLGPPTAHRERLLRALEDRAGGDASTRPDARP